MVLSQVTNKIPISAKILFLCCMITLGLAARNELRATTNNCVCPREQITYECIIVGGEFTLWDASFLDPDCDIDFSHRQFMTETRKQCNNGAIVAEAIEVNNNCYTSQLVVSVTPDLNNGTINCSRDNVTLISTMTIEFNVTPEPPSNVHLTTANPTELVFSWSPPPGSCPSLIYYIDAENCGICQNSITTNTTICTNFALPSVCAMKVYSVTCGNLRSTLFDNTTVNLRVLNIPGNVMIVPHYSSSDSRLLKVETQFNTAEQYSITNEIDGSATGYEITYFNPNTGSSCGSSNIQPPYCRNKTCTHMFEISSSSCPPASNISATVSATNVFGQGPTKNSTAFAHGTNTFVDIKYLSCTIVCNFIDGDQRGIKKECNVTLSYGVNCSQFLDYYSGVSNTNEIQTTPPIEIINGVTEYCFSAIASKVNGTLDQTVVIEGTLNLTPICNGESISGVSAITTLVILVAAVLSIIITVM